MSSQKTIVVTGGLGHIGSRLIRTLQRDIGEIRIVDNLATMRYASLFDLPQRPRKRFFEANIMTSDLKSLFKGADAVIHLAAITDAEATVGREEETDRINVEGVMRVAEACERVGARLFYPSTTSVYGSQESVVDETCEELKPQSPYAVSKLKAEEYLSGRKGKLPFVTCRLGTIFGYSPGMRFHTAVNKFIWQAVNGVELSVWKTAWEQKRPYLELGDCVRAIDFILANDLFDGEIYNIVTKNYAVRDVVGAIQMYVPSLKISYVDSKIMNQLSYDVRAEKIAAKGFSPTGNLEEGIKETVEKLQALVHRTA